MLCQTHISPCVAPAPLQTHPQPTSGLPGSVAGLKSYIACILTTCSVASCRILKLPGMFSRPTVLYTTYILHNTTHMGMSHTQYWSYGGVSCALRDTRPRHVQHLQADGARATRRMPKATRPSHVFGPGDHRSHAARAPATRTARTACKNVGPQRCQRAAPPQSQNAPARPTRLRLAVSATCQ